MIYSEEQQDIHKQQLGTLMVLHPSAGAKRLADMMKEAGVVETMDKDYALKLKNQILKERLSRIREEDKEKTAAAFQDACYFIINQLQTIAQEEITVRDGDGSIKKKVFAQSNRIKALAEIRKTFESLMQMKMDLGIFERHLGTLVGEHKVKEIMYAIREDRKPTTTDG